MFYVPHAFAYTLGCMRSPLRMCMCVRMYIYILDDRTLVLRHRAQFSLLACGLRLE